MVLTIIFYLKILGNILMKYYRPLPDYLTIKESTIEGLGLFAVDDIPKDKILGISHIKTDNPSFKNGLIRTPLGGFINHNNKPNVKLIKTDSKYYIKTNKIILANEEITLKYNLYNPID